MTVTKVREREWVIGVACIPIQRKAWTYWIWPISALAIPLPQSYQLEEGTSCGVVASEIKVKFQRRRVVASTATSLQNIFVDNNYGGRSIWRQRNIERTLGQSNRHFAVWDPRGSYQPNRWGSLDINSATGVVGEIKFIIGRSRVMIDGLYLVAFGGW